MSAGKGLLVWLAVVGVSYAAAAVLQDRDDSDPPKGRSGLVVFTDNKTGCQYLKAGLIGSALTPRMGAGAGRELLRGLHHRRPPA